MGKMKSLRNFYESYWKYRRKIKHLSIKRMPRRILAISRLISVKGKVDILDVGCGDGGLGILLKSKYDGQVSIIGVDISETALSMAKKYYDKVLLLDVEEAKNLKKLFNKKFDYIVVSEVLEHLIDPGNVLKKLRPLLKKKGYFILTFPNFAFWTYRLQLLFGQFPKQPLYHEKEHFHYWTLPSFITFLKKYGVKPKDIDGDFHILDLVKFRFLGKWFPNFFGIQIVIKCEI